MRGWARVAAGSVGELLEAGGVGGGENGHVVVLLAGAEEVEQAEVLGSGGEAEESGSRGGAGDGLAVDDVDGALEDDFAGGGEEVVGLFVAEEVGGGED